MTENKKHEVLKQLAPNIYHDMSNEDYHGHFNSYSKSSLSDFSVYPYNLIFQRMSPKRKRIYDIGTAGHVAILEPEKWEKTVAIIPQNMLAKNGAKSTKECKAWIKEQPADKALLTEKERDAVLRMRDSVHENPGHTEAKSLLTGGFAEVSCFWFEQFHSHETDQDTGQKRMIRYSYMAPDETTHQLAMKCRPDYIQKAGTLVDLKTTAAGLDPEKFIRTAYSLKYHWSAALTLRGFSEVTNFFHKDYRYVVVDTEPPHEVAVYKATVEQIGIGTDEIMRTMEKLAYCDKFKTWPGMPNKTMPLGVPGWVFKKYNEGVI